MLSRVYVEPTNACNLACKTCVRHAWDEPEGFMAWDVFATGAAAKPPAPSP
jgi:MoaA/NifB/PqqE/SkfB family radical SAM enzyme